jgi:hypothetical protein
MSQMPLVNAERALDNRAHVRMLLRLRQPAFAAALASAEQDFSYSVCSGRRPERDNDRAPVSSSWPRPSARQAVDKAFDAALATNIRAPYFLTAAWHPP